MITAIAKARSCVGNKAFLRYTLTILDLVLGVPSEVSPHIANDAQLDAGEHKTVVSGHAPGHSKR